MSIEKISPSSDPHEPEGSGRKMRNVGDKFKKIERTQEVDPENRKKQKWGTENDSPYEVPKSNTYNNPSNPSYTPSSNAPNPNASSPYDSNKSSNNINSSNSSQNTQGQDSNKTSKSDSKETSPEDKKETSKKETDPKDLPKFTETIEIDTPGGKKGLEKGHKSTSLKPLGNSPLEKPLHSEKNEPAHKTKAHHEAHHEQKHPLSSPLASNSPKEKSVHTQKESEKASTSPEFSPKKPHDKKDDTLHKEDKSLKGDLPLQPNTLHPLGHAPVNNTAPVQGAVSSQFSHPEVARLFTELVSHITAISQKGIKEVTITLSSGTFKGSQIILTESSTALRNYNIQLLGATNEASKLFSTHASELMEAFHSKPHPFKINRIDSGHLIRRKEDIDKEGQNSDQEGES